MSILKNVLIVAPHPDDETVGCGGTTALLARSKASLHIVFVTDGGASHPSHPVLSPADIGSMRKAESKLALGILGVELGNVAFLDEKDGSLGNLDAERAKAVAGRIAEMVLMVMPDAIFLPCRRDGSSEHDATFRLVHSALQRVRQRPRVLEYPVWAWRNPLLLLRAMLTSGKVWRAAFPDLRDTKAAALGSYASQMRPIAPDDTPALPPDFASEFSFPEEFFFEQ